MKREILTGPDFCALVEDGHLAEFLPGDSGEQAGDILIGRVERMMPGIGGAFVDIGRKKSGFLPLRENSGSFQGKSFASGDRVIVQIRREEHGSKGAFLSRDLALVGENVILMPMNRHIGVSRRIAVPETRAHLAETGRSIAGARFGLVIRSRGGGAGEKTLREEAEHLWAEWQELTGLEKEMGTPAVLCHRESDPEMLKKDYGPETPIREVAELDTELRRQLRAAGERIVRLPHGGNIVIDRCEALMVIDVNTAGDTRNRNTELTFLETNAEACREIALQVRLRNLSGILLIDLIDMEAEADREKMLEVLREAFSQDRVKTVIHGYTHLGLVEMTRKRSRPELQEFCME